MKNAILKSYKHTVTASIFGYITQAIIVNFAPLLFLTFQSDFNISLSEIALLSTVNFVVQLLVDLISAKFIDKIGYRISIVAAHLFAAAGLVGLSFFPRVFDNHFAGLLTATVIYAIGGGIIEVLVSPIIEACPTKRKSAMMSLLHSFYCWGLVFVIGVSTVFFVTAGIENWSTLALIWAAVPLLNAIYFCFVPIYKLDGGKESFSMKKLFSIKVFWILLLLMLCAGAAEQAVGQWASAFAESGLNVSKTMGDLLGPCLFAVMMGLSRIFYARFSEKINLQKFITVSCILCFLSYLLMVFSPVPVLSLIACGMVGLSVGILWPGIFSVAAKDFPKGGTAMFALLALAGDAGCAFGPYLVGAVSGAANETLKWGILAAAIFPILLIAGIFVYKLFIKKSDLALASPANMGVLSQPTDTNTNTDAESVDAKEVVDNHLDTRTDTQAATDTKAEKTQPSSPSHNDNIPDGWRID